MSNDKISTTGDRDATLEAGHHGAPSQLSAAGYNPREPFGHLKDGDRVIKPSVGKVAAQAEAASIPEGEDVGAGAPGTAVSDPTRPAALRRDVVSTQKRVRTLGAK